MNGVMRLLGCWAALHCIAFWRVRWLEVLSARCVSFELENIPTPTIEPTIENYPIEIEAYDELRT